MKNSRPPVQKIKKKSRIGRLIVGCFLFIVLAAAATVFGAYQWYTNATTMPSGDKTQIYSLVVAEGDNLSSLAPQLEELGLINDLNAFRIYMRLEEPEVNLLVGNYHLPGGVTIDELIENINKGPTVNFITVTIPEGIRYDEVTDILNAGFAELETSDYLFDGDTFGKIAKNPDQFEFSSDIQTFLDAYKPSGKSLEGFLFPDTYNIGTDASSIEVVELLISTLIRRLEENDLDPSKGTRLDNFYEVLNMASITLREANAYQDMRLISDIFIRRLEQGITLGADATLLYPIKDWDHELTVQELNDPTNPYNTRVLQGLPPTPISSPGIDAIKSVFQPKANTYLFYITGLDGNMYWSDTLFGHCENIRLYLNGSC